MRNKITINTSKPRYYMIEGLTYESVDTWFGHTRRDLKMNIIYPEDTTKKYPCLIWICGGGFKMMDRAAHTPLLAKIAHEGYVVASVDYRTSNEATYPEPLQDIKAAIRFLKANSERFNIDVSNIATSGESAGGYLALMSAYDTTPSNDVGSNLSYKSDVKATLAWYPPSDYSSCRVTTPLKSATNTESLYLGFNVAQHKQKAYNASPISRVSKTTVPTLLIHGNQDSIVPFSQSVALYNKLQEMNIASTFIEVDKADHADTMFFQDDIVDIMLDFLKTHLKS